MSEYGREQAGKRGEECGGNMWESFETSGVFGVMGGGGGGPVLIALGFASSTGVLYRLVGRKCGSMSGFCFSSAVVVFIVESLFGEDGVMFLI